MTKDVPLLAVPDAVPIPVPARIGWTDLRDALRLGWADLRASPGYALGFGLFYAAAGWLLLAALLDQDYGALVVPALSGFLLFGPFAALGLYEISRRREAGEPIRPAGVLFAFRRHGGGQIALFGLFLAFVTVLWLKAAAFLYAFQFGLEPLSFHDLIVVSLTSWGGFVFLLAGHVIGAGFAALVFATSVVSLPLLLDRDFDAVSAAIASVRAVLANPGPMIAWGVVVAALMLASAATGLLGLIVALPLLGYATWHLYRRLLPD
jgi:uncharacterized membrane protein